MNLVSITLRLVLISRAPGKSEMMRDNVAHSRPTALCNRRRRRRGRRGMVGIHKLTFMARLIQINAEVYLCAGWKRIGGGGWQGVTGVTRRNCSGAE